MGEFGKKVLAEEISRLTETEANALLGELVAPFAARILVAAKAQGVTSSCWLEIVLEQALEGFEAPVEVPEAIEAPADPNAWECSLEFGCMTAAPLYRKHQRAKNWAAVVRRDPRSPAGLARTFLKKDRGPLFYIVDASLVGKTLEFAADYYSCGGRHTFCREYYRVVNVTEEKISLLLIDKKDIM